MIKIDKINSTIECSACPENKLEDWMAEYLIDFDPLCEGPAYKAQYVHHLCKAHLKELRDLLNKIEL